MLLNCQANETFIFVFCRKVCFAFLQVFRSVFFYSCTPRLMKLPCSRQAPAEPRMKLAPNQHSMQVLSLVEKFQALTLCETVVSTLSSFTIEGSKSL